MIRRLKFIHLLTLVFLILGIHCSKEASISEEEARNIVETSTNIHWKGRIIPFSVFHAHDGMYQWVLKLQASHPKLDQKTTIINIDMHSDAYGGRVEGLTLADYRNLHKLDLGNWMRFLHVNGICTGKKVLVSHPNLIWQMKVDRCAYPENDILKPNSDYDDNWIYGDYLFANLDELANSDLCGPAIVTIDYDYLASTDDEVSREWILTGAQKIARVLFSGKIVPVAVNFTYSDRYDKRSDSKPFIQPSARDFVSQCLVRAFVARGAVFKKSF